MNRYIRQLRVSKESKNEKKESGEDFHGSKGLVLVETKRLILNCYLDEIEGLIDVLLLRNLRKIKPLFQGSRYLWGRVLVLGYA